MITKAVGNFFRMESAAGVVLFAAALFAIAAANTPALAAHYAHFLHSDVGVVIGAGVYRMSAAHFINDGLMALFFFLVGLEIKRELLAGELSSRSRAMLPAVAAVGGMILPAGIYAVINWGDVIAMRGWAIPTATDIAFSLAVLSLLGKRVPVALKVFLTAVAVIDDLGAIAIIAIFYTEQLNAAPLAFAAIVVLALAVLNWRGVSARAPYGLLFLLLWAFVLKSGVHATIAGVVAAMAVPLKAEGDKRSPLLSLEHDLHPPVAFGILPLFAFANAGVNFAGLTLASLALPITAGIALGLVFGKIIGISAAVWLAVRFGIGERPPGCSWLAMISVAALCGIGFTVSLFIGNLAFAPVGGEQINLVKLGVLAGSTIAGLAGYFLLRFAAFPSR